MDLPNKSERRISLSLINFCHGFVLTEWEPFRINEMETLSIGRTERDEEGKKKRGISKVVSK